LAAGWPRGYINGVDLAEKRRLDAARQQVSKVKTRARPWRSIAALVLAVVVAAISRSARADAASAVFSGTPYRALGSPGPIGITYVRVDTTEGAVYLPNSQALGAAIAPAHERPQAAAPPPAVGRPSADGAAR
jgi:hypothetical protein